MNYPSIFLNPCSVYYILNIWQQRVAQTYTTHFLFSLGKPYKLIILSKSYKLRFLAATQASICTSLARPKNTRKNTTCV